MDSSAAAHLQHLDPIPPELSVPSLLYVSAASELEKEKEKKYSQLSGPPSLLLRMRQRRPQNFPH